jgi:hypothetical protein
MVKGKAWQARRTAAQMHALAAVRRQIRAHDSTSGSRYLREFTDSYREFDRQLSPADVEQKISAATMLLVGDYHALPASQRFAATFLEKCAATRPVVLGVEAVLARDQRILDAWWRREIAESELKRRLRFDLEWGYPWEPFYELLSAARDHAEGLYGLDCLPREDLRRIRSRDRHAAVKIHEIRQRHPNALVLVLFGESHMAPQHLPRALRRALPQEKILTVLQNIDALYWQTVDLQMAAVELGPEAICVFNSSPLEKYESYRLCLERWKSADDPAQDFAPAIYNLIFSLARALGFRLDSPRNGTQPKFLADSLPEVVAVTEDSQEASTLGDKPCAYIPSTNTFLIREFDMEAAAAECTRFLHFACSAMKEEVAQEASLAGILARLGARLLSPQLTAQASGSALGDELYQAYLAGKVSEKAVRQLFLARLDNPDQAKQAVSSLRAMLT